MTGVCDEPRAQAAAENPTQEKYELKTKAKVRNVHGRLTSNARQPSYDMHAPGGASSRLPNIA